MFSKEIHNPKGRRAEGGGGEEEEEEEEEEASKEVRVKVRGRRWRRRIRDEILS